MIVSQASWWIITLRASPFAVADVLIHDVFGRLSFLKRCFLGTNWQACDSIMTGKYSAFLPPNWKCQCRGAILSNSYWNVVIQSQWLIIRALILHWSSKSQCQIIQITEYDDLLLTFSLQGMMEVTACPTLSKSYKNLPILHALQHQHVIISSNLTTWIFVQIKTNKIQCDNWWA